MVTFKTTILASCRSGGTTFISLIFAAPLELAGREEPRTYGQASAGQRLSPCITGLPDFWFVRPRIRFSGPSIGPDGQPTLIGEPARSRLTHRAPSGEMVPPSRLAQWTNVRPPTFSP